MFADYNRMAEAFRAQRTPYHHISVLMFTLLDTLNLTSIPNQDTFGFHLGPYTHVSCHDERIR